MKKSICKYGKYIINLEKGDTMNRIDFKSIKETELKIYLNDGKVYYEYEGVEKLRQKYESLLQKYKDIK
tara:strand:+ start:280 stop:486 length:207 start_codon:yes stop_codon:yes gene_type:complete